MYSTGYGDSLAFAAQLFQLPSGVNFTNVLLTAFMCADPGRVKNTDDLAVFFTLSGSMSAKAVQRTLVKLTPDDGLIPR